MKFIQWLVRSSTDAKKVAMSVHGFLMLLLPFIISLSGIANVSIPDEGTLTAVISLVAGAVETIFLIIGSLVAFYGLIRKIITTWNGSNQVLQEQWNAENES